MHICDPDCKEIDAQVNYAPTSTAGVVCTFTRPDVDCKPTMGGYEMREGSIAGHGRVLASLITLLCQQH
jgi:hypothetical protein